MAGSRSSSSESVSGGRIVVGLRVVVVRRAVVVLVVGATVVVGLGPLIVRPLVQRTVHIGKPGPITPQIVRHAVDGIQIFAQLRHVVALLQAKVGHRDRHRNFPSAALPIERPAQLLDELPPRSAAPGYSQSRSNPSNPYTFMNWTTLEMNDWRRSLTATIWEYFLPPSAQPPTAIWYLACGYRWRSSVKLRNPLCSRSTSGSITSTW
uniref:Uncharacterized protein n=1 Tax=Anopheles merus TaxID=30066 RepID=A0A182UXJ2_ANOME